MAEDRNQEKFDQIVVKLEHLFKIHGYSNENYFDSRVWFLKNDQTFQKYISKNIQTSETPMSKEMNSNKMIETLIHCNSSKPIQDLKLMKVKVDLFNREIARILVESNSSVEISDKNIKENESHQKIARITEILKLLHNRIEGKNKKAFQSKLKANVISLTNFPIGKYSISLLINTAFDKERPSNLNTSEKNNLDPLSPFNVANIFNEARLDLQNDIEINQAHESIVFRNKDINSFDQYSFTILEKGNKSCLVDRRFSGTTFSNFMLRVKNKGNEYESQCEYLLHLLLTSIEELCDLSKETLTKHLNIKVYKYSKQKIVDDTSVGIQFNLVVDDLTRIAILNHIKQIILIPVETKTTCLNNIEEILTNNFPDLKESINNILSKQEEVREPCCNGCKIF